MDPPDSHMINRVPSYSSIQESDGNYTDNSKVYYLRETKKQSYDYKFDNFRKGL